VYDDFPITQPLVHVPTGGRFGVDGCHSGRCPYLPASGRKMRRNRQSLLWLGISILGVLTLSPALLGQTSPDSSPASLPTDWSHHHVIFSKPATTEQARRLQQDVRYRQQLARQSAATLPAKLSGALAAKLQPGSNAVLSGKNHGIKRDWSQDMGLGAKVAAGNFPAKFAFRPTTANCASAPQPDFVVYGTGLAGSTGQASIVAYDNLYSGCTGTVPTVYWAYNTEGGTVLTSPVFSDDGTQVAFVQTNPIGQAVLVLLKWAASTTDSITNPTTLTRVRDTAYRVCTAPCMTSTFLQTVGAVMNSDTYSSVFYDYNNDAAYVGDDSGLLHYFTPFFNHVAVEILTGGWPAQVNTLTPTPLTSPVYDYASGNVYVADTGGFLYSVVPSTAAIIQSEQLDFSSLDDSGPGIVEGPIIDGTAGLVYVFAPSDGSGDCTGGADCTGVYQLPINFTASTIPSEAVVGVSTVEPTQPNPLYLGAFDSTYENSVNATGNLYVCGNTGGSPIIYQIPIQAGTMGEVNTGPTLSIGDAPCSPVTDILNPNATGGATEWIFASAQSNGVPSKCTAGGCVMNLRDTPWLPSTGYSVGQEVLDTKLHIEVVKTAGTSGLTEPIWNGTTGGATPGDGTVTWLDQGVISAATPAAWIALHPYARGAKILDNNGNIELVTSIAGVSGLTTPTFNTVAGGTTADGTLTWTNVGAIAVAAMPAAGGTSAIIVDNTVGSGTLGGASQVYFSTLGNQACGTSGTGGCAVQASQSGLQ
jgi:hypothetical protein